MRDTRKNQDYFSEYITYQKKRIQTKVDKLNKCAVSDSEKRKRINVSLLHYKMDLLIAMFSAGANKSEMVNCIQEVSETIEDMESCDYESLLNFLSLAVIYEQKEKVVNVVKKYNNFIASDKLLNMFANYLLEENVIWSGNFAIEKIYNELNSIFDKGADISKVLLEYIENWYENRKEAAWYDSAKSNNDTYVGYWCFECAALAKIMKIDDAILATNEFYPVI